ncbi:MAG: hypothetical protein V1708_02935 [Candidatus Micrarchaeota archaeon]
MPGEELSSNFTSAVSEVKHLRLRGKDYLYCKMFLMAKGYSESAANNIWYYAETTKSASETATAFALQGPYFGILFFGGFMAVFAYFAIVKYVGFFASTIFSFIFLRYSSFAMNRTPIGFALSVKSDAYCENDPPEAKWFNYGVIAGFLFFVAGVYYFPSFLGWTPQAIWDSLVSITDPEKIFPKF